MKPIRRGPTVRHPSANTAASGVLLATREPRPDGSGLYARASKPYQAPFPTTVTLGSAWSRVRMVQSESCPWRG